MNKSKLKSYAPQARKDFIAMVQSRAAQLGIAEVNGQLQVQPCEVQGQVAIIAGQAFPAKIANQRQALVGRMQKEGFAATVDAIAYTWFNRFAALRYMELHNYLGHGQRVLSSVVDGGLPDILTHALELVSAGDLPGVSVDDVSRLKLAGKDGELYKRLLVAQCNQLAGHMGFLFERIDDDSELLLPDNLLRTDSVVRKLVDSIDEADWQQVEIIGWLYQFYISEKKDQVIGKVVKSADIPAATQLFTPNWIVKYLVQNSVGRLWLQANPGSTLASQMAYYIQPAEQTPEVNAQLDALIRTRIAEDAPSPLGGEGRGEGGGGLLNPESITVLDPACGSGHILVEAYDLLKAIYLERGYRERDIPRLILEKNLFGLDIDDRAAQLAAFALLMKARADDRRLFNEPIQLNVLALQESTGLDAAQLAQELGLADASQRQALASLLATFAQAKTFGSLLQVPPALAQALPGLAASLISAHASGDLYVQSAAATLQPLLQQAQLLARQYDAVVANPPYMGSKGMNEAVKAFAKKHFPDSKSDLFAMFIERGFGWCKPSGFNSMVTMQSWMFLSSYEAMREKLLTERTIITMAHLGARAFSEISGEVVQTTAFVLQREHEQGYKPAFFRLVDGNEAEKEAALRTWENRFDQTVQDDFKKIPGSPVAYWVNSPVIKLFSDKRIFDVSISDGQNITADNDRFVRLWWEVSISHVGRDKKWLTYCKGGEFRKWYGNLDNVIDWSVEARSHYRSSERCRIIPEYLWYQAGITWSRVSSKDTPNAFRLLPEDTTFDKVGSSIFVKSEYDLKLSLGILNSKLSEIFIPMLNPTIDLQVRDVRNIPYKSSGNDFVTVVGNVDRAINISRDDWDENEISLDFASSDLIGEKSANTTSVSWQYSVGCKNERISLVKSLEEENNNILIVAYGLNKELSPEVSEDQITLTRANREKDMQRLVSYAIGCMMGRYSLDEPGLIYAHAGNVGFDPQRYTRFAADADGIVPVSDLPWFPDDATQRVKEFLVAVWGQNTLAENLAWLADSLGRKADESPEDALRRYISGSFFKDHCQTYKKRPIYWLFSSGKQKAFEALVYLHRYNDTTLARMRAEYVVPLTGRMAERIQLLEDDALKATTSASRKAIDKQIDKLKKKLEELRQYDEKLRHFADQRITLDLDDGVKVNYGKFGDLLDNVKGITGGAGDD